MRLVGTSEIRKMLGGVSKQRAYVITRSKGFPEPGAKLAQGDVWDADAVAQWIVEHRPATKEGEGQ